MYVLTLPFLCLLSRSPSSTRFATPKRTMKRLGRASVATILCLESCLNYIEQQCGGWQGRLQGHIGEVEGGGALETAKETPDCFFFPFCLLFLFKARRMVLQNHLLLVLCLFVSSTQHSVNAESGEVNGSEYLGLVEALNNKYKINVATSRWKFRTRLCLQLSSLASNTQRIPYEELVYMTCLFKL